MAYYRNSEGKLTSTYGLVGDNYEQKEAQGALAARERGQQSSAESIGSAANKSAEARASTAAEAQRYQADQQLEAAKYRARMAKGGPVTGKYTKGTGAVDIGDWVAPLKSRGGK